MAIQRKRLLLITGISAAILLAAAFLAKQGGDILRIARDAKESAGYLNVEDARAALRQDPNDAIAWRSLAGFALAHRDEAQFEIYQRRAIRINPNRGIDEFKLALVLEHHNRLDEAEAIYRKLSVRDDRWGASARRNLARILSRKRNLSNRATLNAWKRKYATTGIVLIGVHLPRFTFDQDATMVKQAVIEHGITDPRAIDNGRILASRIETGEVWPYYFLFGPDGHLRSRAAGGMGLRLLENSLRRLCETLSNA